MNIIDSVFSMYIFSIAVLSVGILYLVIATFINRAHIVFGQLDEKMALHSLQKSSSGSAGWDVYSNEIIDIPKGTRSLVKTGLTLKELPN